jgi:hypothetical protein
MEAIDDVAQWLGNRLSGLPEPLDQLVPLPLLVVAGYLVLAWVLRRLLPWLTRQVVAPLVVAVIGVLGVAALTGEFLLTQAFRVARRRPARALYAAGDAVVRFMIGSQRSTRGAGRASGRLRNLHGVLVLAVLVALLGWWNSTYCERQPASGACQAPFAAWRQVAADYWSEATG